jgi:hypothetical protein
MKVWEGAPDQIEGRDFVGEEFDYEQDCAGSDYGPGFQQLECWREGDVAEASQETQGCYRGIDVQAGGKGYGCQDGEEFGERDLQEVQHGAKAHSHDRPGILALEALRQPRADKGAEKAGSSAPIPLPWKGNLRSE